MLPKLAEQDGGHMRIRDIPPTIFHQEDSRSAGYTDLAADVLAKYRNTLAENLRILLDRYEFVDVAVKWLGIGCVGTLCLVALIMSVAGRPFFLHQAG